MKIGKDYVSNKHLHKEHAFKPSRKYCSNTSLLWIKNITFYALKALREPGQNNIFVKNQHPLFSLLIAKYTDKTISKSILKTACTISEKIKKFQNLYAVPRFNQWLFPISVKSKRYSITLRLPDQMLLTLDMVSVCLMRSSIIFL